VNPLFAGLDSLNPRSSAFRCAPRRFTHDLRTGRVAANVSQEFLLPVRAFAYVTGGTRANLGARPVGTRSG
jgi:hypothetical protein